MTTSSIDEPAPASRDEGKRMALARDTWGLPAPRESGRQNAAEIRTPLREEGAGSAFPA